MHQNHPRVTRADALVGDPLAAAAVTAAVGLVAVVAGQPWLFPSLGPTALVQIEYPEHLTARFYNTVVGHLVAAVAAYASVLATGAEGLPPATTHVTPERVVAAAVALTLTVAGTRVLHASHPPAASTALLIALGGFAVSLHDAGAILAGVLLVATIGGSVRSLRARLRT